MPIELTRVPNVDATEPAESRVAIQIIGTLDRADLKVLGHQLDLHVEQHGRIRLLIEFVDFKGWTLGGAWEDLKLAFKHFRRIDRIAVVGESRWEKEMTKVAKAFTAAELRYFDVGARERADAWLRDEP